MTFRGSSYALRQNDCQASTTETHPRRILRGVVLEKICFSDAGEIFILRRFISGAQIVHFSCVWELSLPTMVKKEVKAVYQQLYCIFLTVGGNP